MKILITGANGQLGTELRRCIAAGKTELGPPAAKLQRATVLATDVDTLDITNRHEVAAYVRHHAPDAIISCAAFTNVDGCETNREAAFAVNALGARNLAMAAEEIGAKLVHVSTDYVFSGDAAQPSGNTTCPRRARSTAKQSCWASSMYSSSARTISLCVRRGCTATRATTLSRRCFVWPGRTAA